MDQPNASALRLEMFWMVTNSSGVDGATRTRRNAGFVIMLVPATIELTGEVETSKARMTMAMTGETHRRMIYDR